MTETRLVGKPFDIPKTLVWNAYQRVKANKGAAGVDGQSLAEFEQEEKNNLYRLWNRLSSGSYFPPPVRAVEIPKHGGSRTLGVPTVADRIMALPRTKELMAEPPPPGLAELRARFHAADDEELLLFTT